MTDYLKAIYRPKGEALDIIDTAWPAESKQPWEQWSKDVRLCC
jgi:hypothetical protein